MNLVTIRDAVADLGISRPTLYRLLAKHNLTTYGRDGDREAYVDIDALRKVRGQFVPRRQIATPANGSDTSSGSGAQREWIGHTPRKPARTHTRLGKPRRRA